MTSALIILAFLAAPTSGGPRLDPVDSTSRFLTPGKVRRSFEVHVDPPADIAWRTRVLRGIVQRGRVEVRKPGRCDIEFDVPEVRARTTMHIEAQLRRNDKPVVSRRLTIELFPPDLLKGCGIDPPGAAPIGLYDPDGVLESVLKRNGIAFDPIRRSIQLGELESGILLVAPRRAEDIGEPVVDFRQAIVKGMTLVVLEQPKVPHWARLGEGTRAPAPVALPCRLLAGPRHPLLKGLRKGDLQLWGGRKQVTSPPFTIPPDLRTRPIVGSGSGAVVLETWLGKGRAVFCQLNVGESLGDEPIAHLMLRNLLVYARTFPAPAWLSWKAFAIPRRAIRRGRFETKHLVPLDPDLEEDDIVGTVVVYGHQPGLLPNLPHVLHGGGSVAIFADFDEPVLRCVHALLRQVWRPDPRHSLPVFRVGESVEKDHLEIVRSRELSWGIAEGDVRDTLERREEPRSIHFGEAVSGLVEVIQPGVLLKYERDKSRLVLCGAGPLTLEDEERTQFERQLLINLSMKQASSTE